jgi:hypothetical protein
MRRSSSVIYDTFQILPHVSAIHYYHQGGRIISEATEAISTKYKE